MKAQQIDLSRKRDPSFFEERSNVVSLLADQLLHGRLCLVLGAGVSCAIGLAGWAELTAHAATKASVDAPAGVPNEIIGQNILARCGNDRMKFAVLIREALYDKYDSSLRGLLTHPLLVAIGTLCMGSGRGNVRHALTFNYDDLLEQYLRYYGFILESVDLVPSWESRSDVRVYHPHGLLPSNLQTPIRNPIVFAQSDYDEVVGVASNAWRRAQLNLLASHSAIFIGLSGADQNLTSVLGEVKKIHASTARHDAFWGVRFSDRADDPFKEIWKTHGVYQLTVPQYDDVPGWLLDICQEAATRAAARPW